MSTTIIHINEKRLIGKRSDMLYGHFIEHFHRQIYGGVFDPGHPLSNGLGLRADVLDAMLRIKVPILRWPGGCFVSAYHWRDGIGKDRPRVFDKAWRVEDPNTFGTDEYIALCRQLNCQPYICTNAGTGTPEEMSDWVEYCNLVSEGRFAKERIANGFEKPHGVKYWSIGNENYGAWEIGAKSPDEWWKCVRESAKMMKHVDPSIELSAAALNDLDWNVGLLQNAGEYLDWISLHQYWDVLYQDNTPATYEQSMAYTADLTASIDKARGLLTAMGLEKKIKIAFDEWNLRGWHHPNNNTGWLGRTPQDYILPRDKNDDNASYTMADTVFTACFLNAVNRNCDIVGMANYAPVVNTRGCIFTHSGGLVLRGAYHVFDLYANDMGDTVLDEWHDGSPILNVRGKQGEPAQVSALDVLATYREADQTYAVAVVNKDPVNANTVSLSFLANKPRQCRVCEIDAPSCDSFNDIGRDEIILRRGQWENFSPSAAITAHPHSIKVIQLK